VSGSLLLALAPCLLLTTGCVPGYVRVVLRTAPGANGNTPFYLLARKIEPKQYLAQSYSEVAALLDLADASVLRRQLVYPGRTYRFYLKNPQKESLGLYFMLTDPGGTWSLLLAQPVPRQLKASLQGSRVWISSCAAEFGRGRGREGDVFV
jgi:hypothetical protein